MCKAKWMMGVLLVMALFSSVGGVAWAAPASARGRGALQGEVKAIGTVDGVTLTLETARGEVTVLVDEHARFRAPGSEVSSLADVNIGDRVGVRGVWEARDTLRAWDVLLIPPGAFRVQGTVIAVTADGLTLTTSKGDMTLQVDPQTRFFIPGIEYPGLADVTLGTRVIVAGLRDKGAADADDLARGVKVIPTRPRLLVRGKVTVVMNDGFRLNTAWGQVTVRVDERTRFRLPGVESPGLDDLTVGDALLVGGLRQGVGDLVARLVGPLPARES